MGKISEAQNRLAIVTIRREKEETKNALEQSYLQERERIAVSKLTSMITQVEEMSRKLLETPDRDARTSDEINEEVIQRKHAYDAAKNEVVLVQQQLGNRVYDLRFREVELTNVERMIQDVGRRLREVSADEYSAMTRYLRINNQFISVGGDLRCREGMETNEDKHRLISIGAAMTLAKRAHQTAKGRKEETEEVWRRVNRDLNRIREAYRYTKNDLKSISRDLVPDAERREKAAEKAYEEAQEMLRGTCAEILCVQRTTSSTRQKIHEKQQEMMRVKEGIAKIQHDISEGTKRVLQFHTEEVELNTTLSKLNSTLLDLEVLLGRLRVARGVLSNHDAEFAALIVHDVMSGLMGEVGVPMQRVFELWKERFLSVHTEMERLVLIARRTHIEEEGGVQSLGVKRGVGVVVGGDPKRMRDL
jgi:hypothetical protein